MNKPKFHKDDKVQWLDTNIRGTVLTSKYSPKKGLRYEVEIGNYSVNKWVDKTKETFYESELSLIPIKVIKESSLFIKLFKAFITRLKNLI